MRYLLCEIQLSFECRPARRDRDSA